jgi:DNA repair exonuclease SbcCD ATPase subunit
MENYGRSLEITDQAMQAAGTTQQQYLKFQESIEGKTNALTNAWERLYGAMVDSETISGFLEFARDIVEGLISIEENFGLINTILAITIPLLIAFKGELVAAQAVGFIGFIKDLVFWLANAQAGAMATVLGISTLKLAMGGLVAIVGLVVAGTVLFEQHQRKVNEEIKRSNDELKEYVATLHEADELQQKMAERKAHEILAEEAKTTKELREEIEKYEKELENARAIQEIYTEKVQEGTTAQKNTQKILEESNETVVKYEEKIYSLNRRLENLIMANGILNGSVEGLNNRIEEGIDLQEYWENRLAKTKDTTAAMTEVVRSLSDEWHNSVNRIQDLIDNYDNLTNAEKAQAEAMIKAEIAKTEQLKDSTLDRLKLYDLEFEAMMDMLLFGSETLTDAQLKAFKTLKNGVSDALQKVKEFRVTIKDWEKTLEEVTDTTKETVETFKDLSTQIDSENIKSIERYRDTIVEALDEEKEAIDRNKELWERDFEDRKEKSDRYYEDLLIAHDSETDSLKENRDIQSEIEDIQEKQLSIMKLQDELLDAKGQRNVRILTASGWQWVADPNEIKRINEEISSVEDELESAKQKQVEANQDRARERTKAHYEAQKLIVNRAFEDEKLTVTRGYEDQYNIIDDYLDEIKDLELTNYNERLLQLNGFINSYNSKMASIGITSTISGGMQPGFIGSGGTPTSEREEIIQQMKLNSSQWGAASPDERKRLADANLKLGSKVGWTRNAAGEWIDESGKRAYANGGLNNYTGDASMHGTSTRPEMVLNNSQAAGLFNFIKNMGNMDMGAMMNKTPVLSGGGGDTYNLKIMAPNGATLSGLLTQAQQLAKHGR